MFEPNGFFAVFLNIDAKFCNLMVALFHNLLSHVSTLVAQVGEFGSLELRCLPSVGVL